MEIAKKINDDRYDNGKNERKDGRKEDVQRIRNKIYKEVGETKGRLSDKSLYQEKYC